MNTTEVTEQARTHRQKNEILPAGSKLMVKSRVGHDGSKLAAAAAAAAAAAHLFYWDEINSF